VSEDDSEEGKSQKGFEEFASKALRLHRRGSFENLLCQHLIMSVAADPLEKVRLVCEACWMVDAQKTGLDLEQVEMLYTVALSLLKPHATEEFLNVAWGFTLSRQNYARFIQPWRRKTSLLFSSSYEAEAERKRKQLGNAKSEAERFFLFTYRLNLFPSSLLMLKSEFLRWALPLVMGIFEKLSRLVQPDLYKEILGIMRGEIARK